MKGFLFFDIDGTLVDSEAGYMMPSKVSMDAIRQAQQNGYLCFIASGRNYGGMRQFEELGFDGFVYSDGAGILCKNGISYSTPIPQKVLKKYLAEVKEYKAEIILATKDKLFASPRQYKDLFKSAESVARRQKCAPKEIMQDWNIYHIEEYNGEDVMESDISFESLQQEQNWLDHLDPELEYISTSASYGRGGNTAGEVTYHKVTKGNGCKKVVELFRGDMQNTYAFGDSMNDASMLEICQYGIAMGNAVEELKQKANYITDSIEEDGLKKAMEHFQII